MLGARERRFHHGFACPRCRQAGRTTYGHPRLPIRPGGGTERMAGVAQFLVSAHAVSTASAGGIRHRAELNAPGLPQAPNCEMMGSITRTEPQDLR